jgi:glycerophosphoryl diester phosphodiesterase
VADERLPLGALWPFLTDVPSALDLAVASGFRAVHPFVTEVSADLVERAHSAGLAVNAWTVNGPHDLEAFVAYGVDSVITDRLRQALAIARGDGG